MKTAKNSRNDGLGAGLFWDAFKMIQTGSVDAFYQTKQFDISLAHIPNHCVYLLALI